MKTTENPQNTEEIQSSSQASNEISHNHQNSLVAESPRAATGSSSKGINQNKNVCREDIELVQNLIERCLQLYMNRGEVVRTLSTRAKIEPAFTTLVWKKLEEENSEFFRAYYISLKLKSQINLFNQLLEHQSHLMKSSVLPNTPVAPIHIGMDTKTVNSMPMGYPVLQQTAMPAIGQPHFDATGCALTSCHVVHGIPAPVRFLPISINSGKDILMNGGTPEEAVSAVPCSISEINGSPASVASNNHFPFTPSEISGMALDASGLDATLTSAVASSEEFHLGQDCHIGSSKASLGSLGQLWNLNLSELTTDLANFGDLGALEDYTGSPFLPSDSDILLNSPERDDQVEEYFADPVTVPSAQPDEEKL
ncbi:uncharacterized protein LOC122045688 isoform X1 [Zingiber officinale]|uniref:uncharacterized protein LOC122045688 isoform X1 n=1 Tax=Zingiber officinale TaxID=94328 RepID=UPI001C4D09E6|nr:uncharacterized protein LOC122045688 isoform X1 [Zingiber officinale]XP_042461949.1 uncharacterized protein LOC122045688 isoform X1 [Zingiber officinale]XP_042461950.1 uncharacterized protein LOC122045688 isoform X1 [Zingiber officinale]XP_042461951.1 uncharacterized protein LOC122045688 isoform X1 [Zingiber officinale]XP_042461952.1 uncharacterized protein LOC122045688 isoform X1 [Zingiber officinale]